MLENYERFVVKNLLFPKAWCVNLEILILRLRLSYEKNSDPLNLVSFCLLRAE